LPHPTFLGGHGNSSRNDNRMEAPLLVRDQRAIRTGNSTTANEELDEGWAFNVLRRSELC
jgi:hypothetical protein